jgi:hypothetical protein
MKSKRITIVINDELMKKLRIIQSKKIAKSKKSVSFSSIINDQLRKDINRGNSS